jgi:hypothetical protein
MAKRPRRHRKAMAPGKVAKILIASCPSQRSASTSTDKDGNVTKARLVSYASAVEPMEALTAWIVSQLKNASGAMVGLCIPSLMVLMDAYESRIVFCKSGGLKYMVTRQLQVNSVSGDSIWPEVLLQALERAKQRRSDHGAACNKHNSQLRPPLEWLS